MLCSLSATAEFLVYCKHVYNVIEEWHCLQLWIRSHFAGEVGKFTTWYQIWRGRLRGIIEIGLFLMKSFQKMKGWHFLIQTLPKTVPPLLCYPCMGRNNCDIVVHLVNIFCSVLCIFCYVVFTVAIFVIQQKFVMLMLQFPDFSWCQQ